MVLQNVKNNKIKLYYKNNELFRGIWLDGCSALVAVASHDAQNKTPAGLWPAGVCDERNEILKSEHPIRS
jgi:hypothetical protein